MSDPGLLLRYLAISVRGQMEYRASFVMQSLGHLMITGLEFLGVWALFHRFNTVQGWTLPEVAFFYGVVGIAFSFADGLSTGFDDMGHLIRRGDFDRILLRPRSTALQVAGRQFTLRRSGRLIQALAVFCWAGSALNLDWSWDTALLLAVTLGGAMCLFYGLFVIQALMSFWTTETLEIMNTMTYGGVETAQYPLSIYHPWFRKFFTFIIPLGCVTYFPLLPILGRQDPLGTTRAFQYAAPLIGIAFLILALWLWRVGERKYASTGS